MLKNDHWILEQARAGMIAPFEESLIRQIQLTPAQAVPALSYGLSSYGYDIRLNPEEFLIFRHIPGAVVNPKAFSPENLEPVALKRDEYGDYFIIPANSYGLGFSLEKIQMPPNVTVICLGKSTYARCFTGETKVKLVDGDFSFIELIDRAKKGDQLYGYGVENNEIVVQELVAPRYIEDSNLVRVTLDDGSFVDCTPDHKFMLRNGTWVEASQLKIDDSLRPIYQHSSHGYPTIFDSVLADNLESRKRAWRTVHQMTWDCLVRHGKAEQLSVDDCIHHKNGDIFNSHPQNLESLSRSEHLKLHNQCDQRYLAGGAKFKQCYETDPAFREKINKKLHSPESKAKAAFGSRDWKLSHENAQNLERCRTKRWSEADAKEKQSEVARQGIGALHRRNDITEEVLVSALLETGTTRGAARYLNVDRSAFRRFPQVMNSFRSGTLQHNHKVASVQTLKGIAPTYCLTAPETGNFALSNGIFVSNCGLIANTTPLEASWRGAITLEFSNASSTDCRIYANEGVVQLLFFEGEPCMTTYGDRLGKYQNQEGITLPLV